MSDFAMGGASAEDAARQHRTPGARIGYVPAFGNPHAAPAADGLNLPLRVECGEQDVAHVSRRSGWLRQLPGKKLHEYSYPPGPGASPDFYGVAGMSGQCPSTTATTGCDRSDDPWC